MEKNRLRYLCKEDVASVGLAMAEIIDAVEAAFRQMGQGEAEAPPKQGIHPAPADSFIHSMPAYLPGSNSAGIKWVGGFPDNPRSGLPYISGLLILNDVATGLPLAVMDCVWITAMRTGAATALSARYLARPDSSVVGMLGCGVQGRSNVEALNVLFPLEKVMAYDVDERAAARYAEEIGARLALEVVPVRTPREAVRGCDIVVTAGPIFKTPHRTIEAGWLEEGAFASMVDYDSYWHPAAMNESSKFCTDDIPQLRNHQQMGYFKDIPRIHADLGELVCGHKPGRHTAREKTMAANLGLAIEDMAVAPLIYRRASERGIGTLLDL